MCNWTTDFFSLFFKIRLVPFLVLTSRKMFFREKSLFLRHRKGKKEEVQLQLFRWSLCSLPYMVISAFPMRIPVVALYQTVFLVSSK